MDPTSSAKEPEQGDNKTELRLQPSPSGQALAEKNPTEDSSTGSNGSEMTKTSDPQATVSSSLSVTAPPFESTWKNDSSTTSQLSVYASEFVPKSFPTNTTNYSNYQTEAEGAIYSEQGGEVEKSDPLLDYAFQVLNEITCNPGHFNRLCDQLVSTLNSWPSLDDDCLGLLIDELVSQAIREPNFRYNGARMCNAISRQLKGVMVAGNKFRTILFNHCKIIHDGRKDYMLSDAEYVRGFALFMSELFVHMIPPVITTRFSILGQAVREMLLTLLEHPTPANVKCLCQILKLSGSYLEDNDREVHGQAVDMDGLMMKIDTVARTIDMQMHLKDLLRNMIELRATDWGRAPSSPVARESHHHQQPMGHQMGVFYGPDGQALTAEETEFLDQQGVNRHEEEEEYYYAEDEDTGMDDEMVEAFEKFLMMQDALK